MSNDLGKIEAAVRAEYGAIKDFTTKLVVQDFLQGAVYYCEFKYLDANEEDVLKLMRNYGLRPVAKQ